MSTFYGSLNSNYIQTANQKLRLQTEHNTYENIDLKNNHNRLSINNLDSPFSQKTELKHNSIDKDDFKNYLNVGQTSQKNQKILQMRAIMLAN